jgi:hypothetical protein
MLRVCDAAECRYDVVALRGPRRAGQDNRGDLSIASPAQVEALVGGGLG